MEDERVNMYEKTALSFLKAGMVDEALEYLLKALAIEPNRPATIGDVLEIAVRQAQKGDKGPAFETLKKLMKVLPLNKWAKALYEIGNTCYEIDEYDLAISMAERAIEIEPNLVLAHFLLGNSYWEKNRSFRFENKELAGKSLYHYKKFLKLSPNDRDADEIRKRIDT